METKIFSASQMNEAAELIKNGELVAFPTETVYGLGADCQNEVAVKKVYQAKGRPSDNPLIVHVTDTKSVEKYASHLTQNFYTLAEKFWPGPLTMIVKIDEGKLSKTVTGGLKTCAFRMPDHPLTLAFIEKCEGELVGPSANTSGKPSPTTAQHVFHDLKGKIAGILDGGMTKIGVESTVIDLSEEIPTILRPGDISQKEISEALSGAKVLFDKHLVEENETPKAPGMKYKHYAPKAQVYMMPVHATAKDFKKGMANFQTGSRLGILASETMLNELNAEAFYSLGEKKEASEFNHNLFAGLRALDDMCDVILAETLEEDGGGMAYMNRLKKASGNRWIEKD